MANKKKDEGLIPCYLPENVVATGRIAGMFRTRNFVEGAVVAVPLIILIYQLGLPLDVMISVMVILAGSVMALAINGINGDSFSEFLIAYVKYQQRKRVAKYNPRIKKEAFPGYLTKARPELPRDKLIKMYEKYFKTANTGEEDVSRDIYDPMYIEFFEDDIGHMPLPDDLKTKKELKQEAKERKKAEKAKKKAQKKGQKNTDVDIDFDDIEIDFDEGGDF